MVSRPTVATLACEAANGAPQRPGDTNVSAQKMDLRTGKTRTGDRPCYVPVVWTRDPGSWRLHDVARRASAHPLAIAARTALGNQPFAISRRAPNATLTPARRAEAGRVWHQRQGFALGGLAPVDPPVMPLRIRNGNAARFCYGKHKSSLLRRSNLWIDRAVGRLERRGRRIPPRVRCAVWRGRTNSMLARRRISGRG
jgi:hypothetical protein